MTTVSGVAASGETPVADEAVYLFIYFLRGSFVCDVLISGEAVLGVAPVLASLSRV